MKRVDVYFLLLATVLLICGATLGIVMGAREDFQLAPVHAHLNLAGWASLALFGLTYRAYPELAATRLARYHFIVSATASVMLPIGIGLAVLRAAAGTRHLLVDAVASRRPDVPRAARAAARRQGRALTGGGRIN